MLSKLPTDARCHVERSNVAMIAAAATDAGAKCKDA
jgi:hypothetical protein